MEFDEKTDQHEPISNEDDLPKDKINIRGEDEWMEFNEDSK